MLTKTIFQNFAIFIEKKWVENRLWGKSAFSWGKKNVSWVRRTPVDAMQTSLELRPAAGPRPAGTCRHPITWPSLAPRALREERHSRTPDRGRHGPMTDCSRPLSLNRGNGLRSMQLRATYGRRRRRQDRADSDQSQARSDRQVRRPYGRRRR